MKTKLAAFFVALVLGLSIHGTRASVVISNLDPGTPADDFLNTTLGASILTGSQFVSLTSVQFLQGDGFTAGETFAIYSRKADGTVGVPIYTNFTISFDSATNVATAKAAGSFTLQNFSGYWLILQSTTAAEVEWDYTSSTDYAAAFGVTMPATNTSYGSEGGQFIYYDLADGPQVFQVNGRAIPPIPEPSTSALAGLLLAGGAVLLVRSRQVRA